MNSVSGSLTSTPPPKGGTALLATEEDNAVLMRPDKLCSDGRGGGPLLSVDLREGQAGDEGGKEGLERNENEEGGYKVSNL